MPVPRTQAIQKSLLSWYQQHQRELPWRKTSNPYKILVSEVMLQQTQVDRVVPKYQAWIKRFPTIESLSRARLQAVLKLWSGLGYNRRAANLRSAAQMIVSQHGGKMPTTYEALKRLPGVGDYTAKAVLAFAFKQRTGLIDTNVRRVVGRLQFGTKGSKTPSQLQSAVDRLVPKGAPDAWHHAVMDFGSAVCVSGRPKCEACPLQKLCRAYPAIQTTPIKRNQKKSPRFETTDRFWRGRIIALLTSSTRISKRSLQKRLQAYGRLPSRRFQRLVGDLSKEDLVTVTSKNLSIRV